MIVCGSLHMFAGADGKKIDMIENDSLLDTGLTRAIIQVVSSVVCNCL